MRNVVAVGPIAEANRCSSGKWPVKKPEQGNVGAVNLPGTFCVGVAAKTGAAGGSDPLWLLACVH